MQFYRSKLALFTKLDSISDNLDFTMTMNYKHHYSYQTKSGEYSISTIMSDFVESLNKNFGTDFCPVTSVRIGTRGYGLYLRSEVPQVVEESTVVEEPVTEVEDVAEEDKVEVESLITLEVEDTPTVKTPDWEWIESLGTDSESKKELDVYAEEEFGVKLSRTMKFENMVKKFKEELEGK